MKAKSLFYNGRIHTQADYQIVDSMAIAGDRIVAVGNRLEKDPDFKGYARVNLRGKTIVPGLVDAHTHFYYFALSLGRVNLEGIDSIEGCLEKIRNFSKKLGKNEWVLGDGYSPDRLKRRVEPDRFMLDEVTGGRPAFIFSHDQHTVWVNSKALEIGGISKKTKNPDGGSIDRLPDGSPAGLLREKTAYAPIFDKIEEPSRKVIDRLYAQALRHAYSKGVTGVHSMDGPSGFRYFIDLALKGKVGLRVNYYAPADMLPELKKAHVSYGIGTEFFRVAGIKIFSDGSLGSQTALCFSKYIGSKNSYGIEANTVEQMAKYIKAARQLELPCAIHAIGDKAVSNVLEAFEAFEPPDWGARNRIEHLQLVRRSDIKRLKRLRIVASMQPSHCPSDIYIVRKYWGSRGKDAFIFRTLIDQGIDVVFGSDVPIEPLDPIAGIAAAVRRARPASSDALYPEQRITAAEALYRFTVGPAIAAGQEFERGYLLPNYPADFVVLDKDITKVAANKIYDVQVLMTVLGGEVKYEKKGQGTRG